MFGWNSEGNGTDDFGFSALPAGNRNDYRNFLGEGDGVNFWSSTELDNGNVYDMNLVYNPDKAYMNINTKDYAFSVRCLIDDGKKTESSSNLTTLALPCKTDLIDTCVYGELTDSRDDQKYKTVVVGSQTWMAENLNYEIANSYCYKDNADTCSKYGRLYSHTAAVMVCPNGWHLPSKMEWDTLFTAVGGKITAGKMLKSSYGWTSSGNGSDKFGFSALPAGHRDGYGVIDVVAACTYFWSSSENNSGDYYYVSLTNFSDIASLTSGNGIFGNSVRCLKD
jgi:uncharacterized protein (TIGR02145 family)